MLLVFCVSSADVNQLLKKITPLNNSKKDLAGSVYQTMADSLPTYNTFALCIKRLDHFDLPLPSTSDFESNVAKNRLKRLSVQGV
jgi:hypothetical protein